MDSSVESVSRSAEIFLQASYGPQNKVLPISMIPQALSVGSKHFSPLEEWYSIRTAFLG